MYPNNNQPQPGQVFQPQAPQPPAPSNLDFTQQSQPQPPAPQPVQPQAPAFDPNTFKQEVIDGVKQALQTPQPQGQQGQQPPVPPQNQPQYFKQNYDDWGVLEQDTKTLVQDVVKEQIGQITQQNEAVRQQADAQEKQNQQVIDTTLNQLRGAGYLPTVTNPFDTNDVGKQAENELIGYAVYLGTTDLAKAAQELKFKHDTGLKYDYQTKQFMSTGVQQDNGPSIFGSNLPVTPDGQPPMPQYPQPPQQPMYPQQMPQPYGPQNPYMPRPQYPAGFNAPVASGGGYMGVGMQGQVPQTTTLRHNSYDQLVDMFNRTQ